MSTFPKTLDFEGQTIEIIDHQGRPWLTGEQIGKLLGLEHPRRAINTAYQRHSEEFRDDMTGVIKLMTPGGEQEVRIFSPRGCHCLSFFCQTPAAVRVRVWILDVLDGLVSAPGLATSASTELLDTQRKLIAAQEARMGAIEAGADKRIEQAGRHAQEQLRKAYIELDDLKKELENMLYWHDRAVWVINRRMEDQEGLEISAQRKLGYTWTRIASDCSYRSASSLSNQFRMWQARRAYANGIR